ncbi:MAG TPA: helical backbone metal receptor [Mucilaginibacter sp.]|nr:helical backbone metal receptor [Mucilaginibacter sp.]
MPIFYDQMSRVVELLSTPKRIISIVPSQTELLFDLELDEEIVGITKFCIHPADKVRQKVKIGGTKQLNIKLIKELQPDLIIGNKEENEQAQIEELMNLFPVWMSDISDLPGAVDMICKIGELVGKETKALDLSINIKQQFSHIAIQQINSRVAYLVWRKPYMVAGKGTFIDAMLQKCGLVNVFDAERYPEVTNGQLIAAKPDVVFLSSEPYPFTDKHIREFESVLPHAKVKLVDGEMFSWYGSRLLRAPEYFKELLDDL